MPFNWHDYLDLALWLQANFPPSVSAEAAGRAAVSRSYFAAFCYARNYARDYLGFVPRDDDTDHGRLRAHLRQKRRHETSRRLDRLREMRNDCDYHDELTDNVATLLTLAVQRAEYVFRSLPPPGVP
jgi:hypothetical protein